MCGGLKLLMKNSQRIFIKLEIGHKMAVWILHYVCRTLWIVLELSSLQPRKMLSRVASAFGRFRVWRAENLSSIDRHSEFFESRAQALKNIRQNVFIRIYGRWRYLQLFWVILAIISTGYHVSLRVAFECILCGKWWVSQWTLLDILLIFMLHLYCIEIKVYFSML